MRQAYLLVLNAGVSVATLATPTNAALDCDVFTLFDDVRQSVIVVDIDDAAL